MLLTPASRPPGAVQTDSVGKDGGGSLRDETIVTQPAIEDRSTGIKGRARRVFKKRNGQEESAKNFLLLHLIIVAICLLVVSSFSQESYILRLSVSRPCS